jgi:alanine-synthesizing transaminase
LYFEWVAGKIQERRDIPNDGFERMGWAANKPQAGMFVWVELPDPWTKVGSMAFTHQLIKKAYGAVAPVEGFGEEGEGICGWPW